MPRSAKQRHEDREREKQALILRIEGMSYDEVAACVGYASRSGAYKAVERALLETIRSPAETLRTLELDRLREIFQGVWQKATSPDDPEHLKAVEIVLDLMERMDELMGLIPGSRGCRRTDIRRRIAMASSLSPDQRIRVGKDG